MRRFRAAAAAALVAGVTIAAWASPASAHHPAVVTAKKVTIQAGTNRMSCDVPPNNFCDPFDGNRAVVRVVVPDQLRPVQQVCFTFHLKGDLVDPGETLAFFGGVGFINEGTTSIADRTVCLIREDYPDETKLFRDGRATFDVYMEHGTAYLSSVDVVVTGHRP